MIRNRGFIPLTAITFVILMIGLLRYFHSDQSPQAKERPIKEAPTTPAAKPKPPSSAIRHSPLADRINQPGGNAARDLETIHVLLFQMRSSVKNLSSKPMGTNAEFTAVLTGNNGLRLAAIPPDHPAINDNGELIDRWGNPVFFHSESSIKTTLRSAGPDGKLFNEDDIIYPDGP
ncbi:hypothetical protein [Rubellicoccus peritrichatus]|uniref:Type II secretion system protein GspG C-terminal domain-containing protein n=1 Tax=Rubellicoccus peritrichatus TaxID=3080537 RepID=A0AAQ3LFI0_9BACT|nr:hypothetical protein [Puniceicoccus sp. CR14]WOO42808.1 hypothetical protein RZN69_06865 [Puniceicoccus sp. CR14]